MLHRIVAATSKYLCSRHECNIWSFQEKHDMLQSDDVKLKLLKLWEESLYQEFSLAKQSSLGGNGGPKGDSCGLSSSMRYKLRKKHPCPIELEQELRVKNARLPKVVHDGLNAWLKSHKENPYPNKRDKDLLSSKLGITPQQVSNATCIHSIHSFPGIHSFGVGY